MPLTITFPDELATALRARAEAFDQPVEQFTINFLSHTFNGATHYEPIVEEQGHKEEDKELTLEELVAKIKATPPNPAMIQYPTESLLEYLLESTPEPDPNFDIEEWEHEWAKVEAELEALDPPYDPTEGGF